MQASSFTEALIELLFVTHEVGIIIVLILETRILIHREGNLANAHSS